MRSVKEEDSEADPGEEWREVRQLCTGKLVPIPPELVRGDCPDSIRSSLIDIGLPKEGPPASGVTFYHDRRLLDTPSAGRADYLTIGYDYGTILSLKLKTGEIWAVDPNGRTPPRFVNSRLSDFILFLAVYDSYGHERQRASDEEDESIVQEIRRRFTARDPRALDDQENWWSLILEQMSYGLL